MDLNQSPKARFLKTAAAKTHADLVTKDFFRTALDFALMEMANRQNSEDANEAARNAYRLEGARTFSTILLNLAEKEIERPMRMASDNLPNET